MRTIDAPTTSTTDTGLSSTSRTEAPLAKAEASAHAGAPALQPAISPDHRNVTLPPWSRFQAIIGLLTGVLSLVGAAYSGVSYLMAPTQGEVAALVREGKTDRPVSDATVEVLTPANTLVTTLAPAADGWARQSLGAGSDHIRAPGPGYGADTKPIQVVAGRTVEVRFNLTPEGRGGGGPVSRFLGKLGL
jgi:hypothetical protein